MFRIALILLSLAMLPVRANLGETVAECVTRYGKPVAFSEANPKLPFGTMAFVDGGYTLVVFLSPTKDVHEVGARVTKQDKSAFTDAEMQLILNADAAGAPWTSTTSDDPTCLRWTRSDKATVLYDKVKHVLIFTSEEMTKTYDAAPKPPPAPVPPVPTTAVTNAPTMEAKPAP
jgi:hypothetical protein